MSYNISHSKIIYSILIDYFFIFNRSFPESPRWLLACGKFEKAKPILLKMAKVNGKVISLDYMDQLKV